MLAPFLWFQDQSTIHFSSRPRQQKRSAVLWGAKWSGVEWNEVLEVKAKFLYEFFIIFFSRSLLLLHRHFLWLVQNVTSFLVRLFKNNNATLSGFKFFQKSIKKLAGKRGSDEATKPATKKMEFKINASLLGCDRVPTFQPRGRGFGAPRRRPCFRS